MYQPSKFVAGLLGIFVGTLGLHHLYLRRYNVGIIWLLLAILLSWTIVVPLVLAVIGFFQGIGYMFWTDENWTRVYGQS